MPTIEQLAYKIVANTEGFTDGVVATRAELRAARQITEATMSTYEKLERSLEGVTHLYEIGAIDVDVYNKAMADLRQKAEQAAAANNKVASSAGGVSKSVDAASGSHAQLLQSQVANIPVVGRLVTAFQGLPPSIWPVVAAIGTLKVGIDTFSAAIGTIQERTAAIMDLSREAESLGVAAGSLAGWRDAASDLSGALDGQLDSALAKMNQRLADAVHGSGEAGAALAALGLDAGSLVQAGTEESFYAIVDAISAVENQAERSRLAVDIFGRGGAELLNTFGGGAEPLRQAVADAEQVGLALSTLDTSRIVGMGLAFDDINDAFEGFGNRLTARVAPGLTAAANAFSVALEDGQPLYVAMEAILDGGEAIAENFGWIMDLGAVFMGPAISGAAAFVAMSNNMLAVIANVNAGLAAIGIGNVDQGLQRMVREIASSTERAFEAGSDLSSKGMNRHFSRMFSEFRAEVDATEPKARRFGGALLDIAENAEKAAESQSRVHSSADKWADIAARVANEVRTPMEVFYDRLEELRGAVEYGGLTWEAYERAVAAAEQQLLRASEANKQFENTHVAAVERGTQAAIVASEKAIAAQRRVDEQARIRELANANAPGAKGVERLLGLQVSEQKDTNSKLGAMLDMLSRGGIQVNEVEF